MHVLRFRNDIKVSGKHQRLLGLKPLLRIFKKSRYPAEFRWIFLCLRWITIGQIETGNPQHAMLERDHALQKTGVDIFLVPGEPRRGLVERQLREERDAVKSFLAVGDDVVAERLDSLAGKRVVDTLDFLQANNIGCAILEPGQEMVEPLPDRIDVPRSNPHQKGPDR